MKVFALFVFGLLICTLSGVQSVSAEDVGNGYKSTDSVSLERNGYYSTGNCANKDITSTYAGYLMNNDVDGETVLFYNYDGASDATQKQNLRDSYTNALANGSWGVSQIHNYSSYSGAGVDKTVMLWWTDTRPSQLTFYNDGLPNYNYVKVTGVLRYVMITYNNGNSGNGYPSCNPMIMGNYNNANTSYGVSISSNGRQPYDATPKEILFAAYANVTYPVDYAGVPIKESNTVAVTSPKVPDMYMINMIKWHGTFADKNFFSFDVPEFVCADNFPPRLHLELWDKSDSGSVLVFDDVVSANSQLDYEFKQVNRIVDYQIVSWYSCTDESIVFDEVNFYNFKTDVNGGIIRDVVVYPCVLDVYPWIDTPECIRNVSTATALMSFGTIKFGNEWGQEVNECRTLGVIGDWLMLENKTVCPQIDPTIRNIITPFVTFALGLMMISFIANKVSGIEK